MPTFLVTATIRDAYRQTVHARDEREATRIAQSRPNSWRFQYEEDAAFDAQQVLLP